MEPSMDLSELHRVQLTTIDRLLSMTERQHFALWKTLDAPSLSEMCGEYTGLRTLVGADEDTWKRAHEGMYNPASHCGYWLGKAFRQDGANEGEGYNRWSRVGGRVERCLRFATWIGPSIIDERPSLQMRYAAFQNRVGEHDLCDEIRKYKHDVYLGIATRAAAGSGRTKPTVFMLAGPGTPWRGVDDEGCEV